MTDIAPKAGSMRQSTEPEALSAPDDGRFAMDFPEPILTLVTEIDFRPMPKRRPPQAAAAAAFARCGFHAGSGSHVEN